MFKPFMELAKTQSVDYQQQNDNIGLGLAASHDTILAMGGDIMIEQSMSGLTVFRMRTPCKLPKKRLYESKDNLQEKNLCLMESFNDISRKVRQWRDQLKNDSSLSDTVPDMIAQVYGQHDFQMNTNLNNYLQKLNILEGTLSVIQCKQELMEEIKAVVDD